MEKRSNNELAGLQSIKKQLVASEQELQNRLSAMEMGPFLAKLSYDFYHLRDFAVSGYIDLKPAMSPDLDRDLDYSEYVTLVGDSNDSLGPVRLERDRASKQPTETGITGINIQFSPLTIAEQNKVIGKHINMLTHINKIKLVFYCNTNDQNRLDSITQLISGVQLSVLVNGRPLWLVDMSKPDLTVEKFSDRNLATFVINMNLEDYGETLLGHYEALFADEESRHPSGTPIAELKVAP
jgi:hypothetical protein